MRQHARNVLIVGVTPDEFGRFSPFLARQDFVVDRFPSAKGALQLTATVPFELLVVRSPLPGMEIEEFVDAVRQESSLCSKASLVLLETGEDIGESSRLIGRGVNRIVGISDARQEIQDVVSELLSVAPRKAARFLSRFEVKFGGAKDLILCQTENLSASGMLIQTERRYEIGIQSDFEFTLPEDPRPIAGTVEIVRTTMIGKDSIGGIGVRFIAFSGDSERRYRALLDRM